MNGYVTWNLQKNIGTNNTSYLEYKAKELITFTSCCYFGPWS